ncbi:MAG: TetR/AcrR family transcriptional regulator [Phascolarctobacterium sp.]|nr:TetR/AcrR family transcriptional regulator [Phascolarctobacterium sp.]
MDRRQKRTRDAIFVSFTSLLSKKHYNQISVQEIIDLANIGRTTFYAHFETKDYLLKDLCEELFAHIIGSAMGQTDDYHLNCKCVEDTVFSHLLCHLKVNDRNIIELLTSQNNEIFLRYFKCNLKKLIITQYADKGLINYNNLPQDYVINHIASSFVETVEWWLKDNNDKSPQEITEYFLTITRQFL